MTAPRSTGPGEEAVPLGGRVTQVVMALVVAAISVLLMVTIHRVEMTLGPVRLPAGLLLGALFQVVACVFLLSATGSRLPLLVLGSLWGVLATPFLGTGAGGGVLMPAVVADEPQLSGWIVQGLGVGIPFLAALAVTVARRFTGR